MTRRRIAALATAAVVTSVVLFGSSPAPAATATCAPSHNADRLRQSISILDGQATGALIRFSGPTGCFRGTSGVADLATGKGIREDSRFRAGSITKAFTSVAVLQLAAEGLVDLDRPVIEYLPYYMPQAWQDVKVRHLLNYTSGIPGLGIDHKNPDWFLAHRFDSWDPGSQVDRTKPLDFPAGTFQRYGNSGHIVAGMLIEKVTGRPYGETIERGIIRPLRLHGTSMPGERIGIPGPHAKGYEQLPDGSFVDITKANPSYQWSAAEMITTAPDLEKFLTQLLAGRLLPPAQQAELLTVPAVRNFNNPNQDATYSAGLVRIPVGKNIYLWGKTGDRPGYQSAAVQSLDGQLRIAYSVNTIHMGGDRNPIAEKIVAAALS